MRRKEVGTHKSKKMSNPSTMKTITTKLIAKTDPDYETIGRSIESKESAVGIDARHTHIIIIKKLTELEEKLDRLLKAKKKKKGKKK
jgi:hypothetical protein